MAFNNYGNNQNNNNQNGEKKRTNFPVGKIWGSDGQLFLSIWVSDTGVKGIVTIKREIGKDPSSGSSVLEQKKDSELPRFFMNTDQLLALVKVIDSTTDLGTINATLTKHDNSKLSIVGNGNSITVQVETKQGQRAVTLDSIAVGSKNIHAGFINFFEYLKIVYKKALINKLNPEEFGFVNGNNEDDETPFV